MNSSLSHHEILSSTPKNKTDRNYETNDNLSPIDITDILNSKVVLTPKSRSEQKREKLPSILKNSPNKSNTSFSRTDISDALLKKHPELKMATSNGEFNPVKGARVLFSPTKEILSYRNDYFDISDTDEENVSHLSNLSKKKSQSNSLYNNEEKHKDVKEKKHNDENKICLKNESNKVEQSESFIKRALTDPTIPYILSLYLQLFLNLVLVSIVLYFLFIFIRTIRSDIHHKLEIYTQKAVQKVRECGKQYYQYKCAVSEGETIAPAIQETCSYLETCMNSDPSLLGKSKITAETFADIVNGFVRPISWKALIFLILLVFGSLFITNIAFGSYRNSSNIKSSQKEKEHLEFLEKKIKDQEELLMKYEYLNERIDVSKSGQLEQANTYMITNSANSPIVHRLQSPQNLTNTS